MTEDIQVSMFGSAYALLLHQLAESAGNQEGFLLGSRVRRQYRENSDSSSHTDKQHTLVHLSTILPLRGQCVYEPSGAGWKAEACKQVRKASQPHMEIVGFYQLRKLDVVAPSLKDRRLMARAGQAFHEPFVYLILAQAVADSKATYKYSSAAYIAATKPVPAVIEILNLGKGEEIKYTAAPAARSKELSQVTKMNDWPEQIDAMKTVVDRFEHIHEEVVEEAERMKENFIAAEKERKRMEEEVQRLRRNLQAGKKISKLQILAGDLINALTVIEDPVKDENDNGDEVMPLISLIRVKNNGEKEDVLPNQPVKDDIEMEF